MFDQYLVFLLLALMFLISYFLHLLFDRIRMPGLLAPFLVGLIFQGFLPFSMLASSVTYEETFTIFAQLGVVFLLFLIGFPLDVKKLKELSKQIVALTVFNFVFPSVLGFYVLISFGYPPIVSILVSTALATVAETTIAPILDELGALRTKVANLIIGPGILDDVAEIMIASIASVIIGAGEATVDLLFLTFGLVAFLTLTLAFTKVVIPSIERLNYKPKDVQLFLLIVSISLLFTAVSQALKLGILLGAIVGGLTFQKLLKFNGSEQTALTMLRPVAYGFLGPIFFFLIGLNVGFTNLIMSFQLATWLLIANYVGKFFGAYIVGKSARLKIKEIIVIGIGLSAKFSMGIIPVHILYAAGAIDQRLFSAFVAVSAITTMFIPFALAYTVNKWRQSLT